MRAKEDTLFARWRNKRKKLVPDGVVKNEIYQNNDIKVLYVLKEVNGGEERNSNWDLRDFVNGGGHPKTWNNIARWQHAIENFDKESQWLKVRQVDKEFRINQLRKISAINLKKEPGGATSEMKEIWEYAWADREYLREQIEFYDADIIICCGTGEIVKKYKLIGDEFFKDWKAAPQGLKYHITQNNKLIISHCHPQNRASAKAKFSSLVNTMKATKGSIASTPAPLN